VNGGESVRMSVEEKKREEGEMESDRGRRVMGEVIEVGRVRE
jgi:hypothetical protein